MTAQPNPTAWTVAAYLAFERESAAKHEYLQGEVYPVRGYDTQAMAGASEAHVLLTGNIFALLHAQAQEQTCRVYQSDMRVQAHADAQFYPDVTLVCDAPHFTDESRTVLTNPAVVVEVLSPSTEDFDRGQKFVAYRQCAPLQTYLLVAQDKQHIEHYQRQADGSWLLREYNAVDETLSLVSVAMTLTVGDIYATIDLDAT